MDGKALHQVQVIATIRSISPQTTHTLFVIDDQGAKIKCKLWSSDDSKQSDEEKLEPGDLVKVIGKVDVFHHIRSINVHHISKITDFKHVYLHGLEVIFAYELNNMLINQHIPSCQEMWTTFIKTGHTEQLQMKMEYEKFRINRDKDKNKNKNQYDDYKQNDDENNLNVIEKNVLNFLRSNHKEFGQTDI